MPRATIDRFEQRKLTRAKLVDAALKLFSTSGYEHATVDDISREAGYSKGAYYFHFSTKDDILTELLRMWTEDRSTVLAAADGDASSADGLRDVLAAFFTYEEQRWPAVLLEFWSQALRNDEVAGLIAKAYSSWRGRIAAAFEQAAAAGAVTVDSAHDAAAVALAAHDGYAVQVAITPDGARTPMTAADLADSIITPLAGESRPAERRAIVR